MNPEESVSGFQRNSTVFLISVGPRFPQLVESRIYGNVHSCTSQVFEVDLRAATGAQRRSVCCSIWKRGGGG